jgi:hypothetical protein
MIITGSADFATGTVQAPVEVGSGEKDQGLAMQLQSAINRVFDSK